MITRRRLLTRSFAALGATALGGAVFANAPQSTPRPRARGAQPMAPGAKGLETILSEAGLSGAIACCVADAGSGAVLEQAGGDEGLPPASVAKALTTLYALETLGGDYRFSTRLVATGPVQNGVLRGDLVLAGGGDPTLDTDGLAELAGALRSSGLREVRGRFLVWDDALPYTRTIDAEQPDHVGYSPAVSGIALNFNRVHFEWKRAGAGWAVNMDARTAKYRPEVFTSKMSVAQRTLPVYTYADKGGVDTWSVSAAALGKGGSRWLPVRNPALYAGDVFQTLLRANGIVLPNPVVTIAAPSGEVLARKQSAPLRELLRDMLKYSNNLMAEMIGMTATVHRTGKPVGGLAQSGREMSTWAKARYGMATCAMEDHSGLGGGSRLSARDLVRALVVAHQAGTLRPLLKPVKLRDDKGREIKSHPVKVEAKTGTLNFVSGLGGFMTTPDGRDLAFAIFCADLRTRRGIRREDRERPPGARSWNGRAKRLQQALIERWGQVYDS